MNARLFFDEDLRENYFRSVRCEAVLIRNFLFDEEKEELTYLGDFLGVVFLK